MEIIKLKLNNCVYTEGDKVKYIYFVKEGKIEVYPFLNSLIYLSFP